MRISSYLRVHLFNNNSNSAYKLALKDPKKYSAIAISIINKENGIADKKIIKMQKKNREIESIAKSISSIDISSKNTPSIDTSSIEKYTHGNNIKRITLERKFINKNNERIEKINFIMGNSQLQPSNLTTTPPHPHDINTTHLSYAQNHVTAYPSKYYWRSQY
ncbi:hypothetical protein JFY74_18330 [Pectobacterium carotovorum]|nr:hypothetical protein JFY74_18330 [Pectobacterium carotovorum]